MQIIYGYSNCTDKKYIDIVNERKVAVLQPDQKYHSLLIKGLEKSGATVHCFSGLPVNRAVTGKLWISEPDEREGNAYFHYYKTVNLPFIRQLMIFVAAFTNILKLKKQGDTAAICDCLNIANAYGIALACRLRHIPLITIVTDLPDMLGKNSILHKINNTLFGMMDGFIFLTEQMNERINQKNCPYIVLEGHVDSDASQPEIGEKWESCSGKKVVIYAGSLLRLYGIQNLVKGFIEANVPQSELRIFGDGDYRDELIAITKKYENVKYMGVCANQEIVNQEMKAALLVNPRPSAPEYTRYSFPSKNMEYMVSGTPVLTTKLPGMPKEYYPYVYLLEDETPAGIATALKSILSENQYLRTEKASKARAFVLSAKSNVVQGKKIIEFIRRELTRP